MRSRRLPAEQRDLLRAIAYSYLQHGHPEWALPLFRLMVRIEPMDYQASVSLACTLVRMKRGQDALQALEQLGQAHAATALTWLLRGQALSLLGRMPEAARAMRRFVALRASAGGDA